MNNNTLSTAKLREVFFIELYKKCFYNVARYVAKMGGSLEEAEDIFQDSLIVYYEKVTSQQGETILNEKAYLLGIAKNLWLQRYKAGSKDQRLNNFDVQVVPDEDFATNKILYHLETAGKKCMELLKAYYYDCLPVDAIASSFGYSGKQSVTVAKYKCLEKVRETVKQKSLDYADFIE